MSLSNTIQIITKNESDGDVLVSAIVEDNSLRVGISECAGVNQSLHLNVACLNKTQVYVLRNLFNSFLNEPAIKEESWIDNDLE